MDVNAFQNKMIIHHCTAPYYFGWHDNTDGWNNGITKEYCTIEGRLTQTMKPLKINSSILAHKIKPLLECTGMLLLHLGDLRPCLALWNFFVPLCHVLLVSEELPSSLSIHDIMWVWKVRKVSQGEFIASQVFILWEYFIINIEDLLQFILIFSNNSIVLTNAQMAEMRNECQLKDKCRAGRAEVLSFCLKPLFYWCPF